MCPRCGKGTHLVLGVIFCKDAIHCCWSQLTHGHWAILRDAFELVEAA